VYNGVYLKNNGDYFKVEFKSFFKQGEILTVNLLKG